MVGAARMTGQTSQTSQVVVGVDGGGTKTDVVVAALDGTPLATTQTGGVNHEGMGIAQMADVLALAVDETLELAGAARSSVAVAVFGLAGVDWDSDVAEVSKALHGLGLGGSMNVVNDSSVALRAGCTQPWGMVSSIGTGTVTAGVDRQGQWFRTMAVGWGEPSGSWSMVSDSLHAIAAHHHGTGPSTVLTELFLEALDEPDVLAMFEAITRGRSSIGGHLAPLLDEAVLLGDAVADAVLTDLGNQRAAMVVGVANRIGLVDDQFELVTSGGVHAAGGRFSEVFIKHVTDACCGVTVAPLQVIPAMGAVTLAVESLERPVGAT